MTSLDEDIRNWLDDRHPGYQLVHGAGMNDYIVERVRKERAVDGSHEHLEGVCTTANQHYTRREVVDSINAGDTWRTRAGGYSTTIQPVNYCPGPGCLATPYIATKPNSTRQDNLENLPRC